MILALIAASASFGAHWAIPQIYTWSSMILVYSENSTLMAAVEDTFSGKKPCGKCHQIAKLKYEDRGSQLNSPAPARFALDPVVIPVTEKCVAFIQTLKFKFDRPGQILGCSFRTPPATPPPDFTLSS